MTAAQLKALREIAEIIEQLEDMPHVAAALRESAQEIERLTEALRNEREAKSTRRIPPPAVKMPGFNNLHARVGNVFDTDKHDESEALVAEVDPYGFMHDLKTRQEVAELFASSPCLAGRVQVLRNAVETFVELDDCDDQRDALLVFDVKHGIKPGQGRYNFLTEMFRKALDTTEGEKL